MITTYVFEKQNGFNKMRQYSLTKNLFFVSNSIYTVLGVTLLGIGIWIIYGPSSFIQSTEFGLTFVEHKKVTIDETVINYIAKLTDETSLLDGLIIIGVSILVIALIGWQGALMQWKSFLVAYCLLICLMILMQIGIIEYIMIENARDSLLPQKFKEILKESIELHYQIRNDCGPEKISEKNSMTKLWDVIMIAKNCCGVDNYTDFENASKCKNNVDELPIVCCKNINIDATSPFFRNYNSCQYNFTTENSNMNTGCFQKFTELVNVYFIWMRDGFFATLGLQMINTFLAISIAKL